MINQAAVSVPATSANLGPGFDSIGVALELRDVVAAKVSEIPGVRVSITGEGAGLLPTDETHLVAKVLLDGLAKLGSSVPGAEISCQNQIPQGKGLGSSAAAIVAGLALAQALVMDGSIDLDWVFAQASEYEGHPDNAGACVYGGLTVAWMNEGTHRRTLQVLPEVQALVGIPADELLTDKARGLLPSQVPHEDAAFNAARSALLIIGLTTDPSVLIEATEDRLHQNYRADAYRKTIAAITELKANGIAACVSGAGPAVLVFATEEQIPQAQQILAAHGFSGQKLEIAESGLQTLDR